jgi:hypothetical protein
MHDPQRHQLLLDQIEAKQVEVLARLEELNDRAEKLLRQCLAGCGAGRASPRQAAAQEGGETR